MNNASKTGRPVTIGDLYPTLKGEQLQEAEDNLARYVEICARVYERIRLDPEAYARFTSLTARKPAPTMESERSNNNPPQSTT